MQETESRKKLQRLRPPSHLEGVPCCIVAVACALGTFKIPQVLPEMQTDGYVTRDEANRFIRKYLKVRKRTDYRRGDRPLLKDLDVDGMAVVCVRGHFLFMDGTRYYSFFNNEHDEVVTVWKLD